MDLRKLRALNVIAILFLFFGLMFLLSCYSTKEKPMVTADALDHPPHKYPNTEVIGDHHVTFMMDHTDGAIKVWISDASEKPYLLEKSFIKAIITNRNGIYKEIRLSPTKYKRRRIHLGKQTVKRELHSNPGIRSKWVAQSSVYYYKADFLKSMHQFTMKLEVPIEGVLHIAKFDFEMPEEENAHHRH